MRHGTKMRHHGLSTSLETGINFRWHRGSTQTSVRMMRLMACHYASVITIDFTQTRTRTLHIWRQFSPVRFVLPYRVKVVGVLEHVVQNSAGLEVSIDFIQGLLLCVQKGHFQDPDDRGCEV